MPQIANRGQRSAGVSRMERPSHPLPTIQANDEVNVTRPKCSRFGTAVLLALIGAPVGAILCTGGYHAVVVGLELALRPSLQPREGYGQLRFLLIPYFGLAGLFFGASFGLLPYTRFLFWLPVFVLLSLFALTGVLDLINYSDATVVECSALFVVAAVIILLAWGTSFAVCRRERRTT